jgi:hypothetical protein
MKTFEQLNAEYLARYKFNTAYNYYLTRIALLPCVFFSWAMVRGLPNEQPSALFLVVFVLFMGTVAYCVTWGLGLVIRPIARWLS